MFDRAFVICKCFASMLQSLLLTAAIHCKNTSLSASFSLRVYPHLQRYLVQQSRQPHCARFIPGIHPGARTRDSDNAMLNACNILVRRKEAEFSAELTVVCHKCEMGLYIPRRGGVLPGYGNQLPIPVWHCMHYRPSEVLVFGGRGRLEYILRITMHVNSRRIAGF